MNLPNKLSSCCIEVIELSNSFASSSVSINSIESIYISLSEKEMKYPLRNSSLF